MECIKVKGYTIELRTGANFRNLSLRMAPNKGVWVNVPHGFSKSDVVAFIESHTDWLEKNIQRVHALEGAMNYGVGSVIHTRLHTIKVVEHGGANIEWRKVGNEYFFYVPLLIKQNILNRVVKEFVANVMKHECKQILPQRVKELAERYGFKYQRLSFRNNSSNWGSCSGSNNISLNVKLMKIRDEVIDYVILHELCHTVIKNHSNEFWNLMTKVCPDWPALRGELKRVKDEN